MARRGSRPSLYEVGSSRLSRDSQSPPQDGDAEQPAPAPSPPRRIHLPTGFAVLGLIVVVGVILVAWWMGRTAAHQAQEVDQANRIAMRVSDDPLAVPLPAAPVEPIAVAPPQPPLAEPTIVQTPVETPKTRPQGDPRQKGLYYVVLAETRRDGGEAMADFCWDHGLEVAVISGHNARNVKVIALPGLVSKDRTTPANRALDQRIRDVGRLWKESGQHTNFSDNYYQKK